MSYLQKQSARIYNNHVESLKEAGDCKKTCRKILIILHVSSILSKKMQYYQDLNKDIQHRSNKYLTQKLNVVSYHK